MKIQENTQKKIAVHIGIELCVFLLLFCLLQRNVWADDGHGWAALKKLYGAEAYKGNYAILKNEELPESYKNFCQSGQFDYCEVRIVFSEFFRENHIQKRFVITAAKPADPTWHCHACRVIIGGAVFRQGKKSWEVEGENKYIDMYGVYGTTNSLDFNLIELGLNRHGVAIYDYDCSGGYMDDSISLLTLNNTSINKALFVTTGSYPTDGVCPEASYYYEDVEKPKVSIETFRDKSKEYFDIIATLHYNSGYLDVSKLPEQCDDFKKIIEKRYFVFENGKYQRASFPVKKIN